jgi:hypothetical protein
MYDVAATPGAAATLTLRETDRGQISYGDCTAPKCDVETTVEGPQNYCS